VVMPIKVSPQKEAVLSNKGGFFGANEYIMSNKARKEWGNVSNIKGRAQDDPGAVAAKR